MDNAWIDDTSIVVMTIWWKEGRLELSSFLAVCFVIRGTDPVHSFQDFVYRSFCFRVSDI
jgi:hypothetical protein